MLPALVSLLPSGLGMGLGKTEPQCFDPLHFRTGFFSLFCVSSICWIKKGRCKKKRKGGAEAVFNNQTDLFIRLRPWVTLILENPMEMEGGSLGKTHIYRKMQLQTSAISLAVLSAMTQLSGYPEEKQQVGKLGGERVIRGSVWKWMVVKPN